MKEELERDMKPKLIGETYMREDTENSTRKYRYGLYECQYCGKEWETMVYSIKSGTKSCGCQKNKQKITHGRSNSRFYETWNNIFKRCTNPKNKYYKDYGGRGITVCEEWLDVATFVAWAELTHPNSKGVSLDRIDNDLGYNPENCRWADKTTQAINQRIQKNNTSGFVGINWYKITNKWVAKIKVNKVGINLGYFDSKEEAVQARDNYIIQNNLPHKLSTDYKREES